MFHYVQALNQNGELKQAKYLCRAELGDNSLWVNRSTVNVKILISAAFKKL